MSSQLIFRPQLLLLMVLAYPLLYVVPIVADDLGYVLDNIFLIPLSCLIVLLTVVQGRLSIRRRDLGIYLLFFAVIVLVCWHMRELRYTKPILVLTSLLVTYHLIGGMSRPARDAIVVYLFVIYLFASAATLLMPSKFQEFGRFSGFALTPTVFSVYLEAMLIAFLYTKVRVGWKILAYGVVFVFVVLSGTRLNLLFLAGLPFLALAVRWFPSSKGVLQIFILAALSLLYPVYAWYGHTTGEFVTAGRYDDPAQDRSFELRLALSATLTAELAAGGAASVLMGEGAGTARKRIIESFHEDLLPHNDFLRVITDFGLVALVLYLTLLFLVAARSNCSFILMNLYLITFYHNMIYSYYLLFMIVYFSLDTDRTAATQDLGTSYDGSPEGQHRASAGVLNTGTGSPVGDNIN